MTKKCVVVSHQTPRRFHNRSKPYFLSFEGSKPVKNLLKCPKKVCQNNRPIKKTKFQAEVHAKA